MKYNLLSIYCLLASFFLSFIILFSSIYTINHTLNYYFTETTNVNELYQFETIDNFEEYLKYAQINEKIREKYKLLKNIKDKDEMRAQLRSQRIMFLKKTALSKLIENLTWLFSSIISFLIHLKIYKRFSKERLQ